MSLKEVVFLCAGPGNDEAWEEFVYRVGKPISLAIRRTAALWGEPSLRVVEDILQVTYLKLWEGGKRLLHDLATERPDTILAYLKKTATNATHDHFRHDRRKSGGGSEEHVSTSDVDPEASARTEGSEDRIAFGVLLKEIDDYLTSGLGGSDSERDRAIFWLYFRQGMSASEIATLPTIDLTAKGVESVLERLKRCIREQVLGGGVGPAHDAGHEKENHSETRITSNGGSNIATLVR